MYKKIKEQKTFCVGTILFPLFQCSKSMCIFASNKGHLDCLKFLHHSGCPWTGDVIVNSIEHEHGII